MEHQAALLIRRLGLDESHVGPGDRFADGLGVSGIVLLSLHVGLHIGWRHQPYDMSECLELTRPMMRRSAGFDPDQARLQLLEERETSGGSADGGSAPCLPRRCRAREKPILRCREPIVVIVCILGASRAPTSMALACRWRSRPQHQKRGSCFKNSFRVPTSEQCRA